MPIKCSLLALCSLIILLSTQSCSTDSCGATKDGFLERYDAFMEDVKTADLAVSDEGWARYDDRFKTFVEVCYESFEPELSGRERRQFWTKAMGYYYNRYGKGLSKELFENNNSTNQKMQEKLQELWDNPRRTFQDLFE